MELAPTEKLVVTPEKHLFFPQPSSLEPRSQLRDTPGNRKKKRKSTNFEQIFLLPDKVSIPSEPADYQTIPQKPLPPIPKPD